MSSTKTVKSATPPQTQPLGEAQLVSMLAARYPEPRYAFFPQVRNGTGYQRRTRTVDALAASLWPSQGLHYHGFEIKTYRGDWIRERYDPEKADEIARFCTYWWLVVGRETIVDVEAGELPDSWGLLVPRAGKLVARVEPKPLSPREPTRAFVAAILRKATEGMVPKARITDLVDARVLEEEQRWQSGRSHAEKANEGLLKSLQQSLVEFEQKSGIKIDQWKGGRMGEAVRYLMEHNMSALPGRLDMATNVVRGLLEHIGQAKVALNEINARRTGDAIPAGQHGNTQE